MFSTYFAAAIRHLRARKLYSVINLVGLTVGLAAFVLIALFVVYELSYDRHYANADRIYRISRDFVAGDDGGYEMYFATMPPGAAALLEADFPQIETTARITGGRFMVAPEQSRTDGDEISSLELVALADPALLEIFDFEWLAGDPVTALDEPFSVVVTERTARRYFRADAAAEIIGRTLTLDDQYAARITGVIADLPGNTHLELELLLSMASTTPMFGASFLDNNPNWSNNNFYTYVLLEADADIAEVQSRSGDFLERHLREDASRWTGFTAMPVTAIHFGSARQLEMKPPGSRGTVSALAVIGALILLIACINFTNLATALATQRAKEVGVRKTAGAARGQMIAQFLGESVVLSLIAVTLAVVLVELALPAYEAFVEKDLSFEYLTNPWVAGSLLGLALVVGVAAGAYPAFYLSAFNPVRVLKGDVTRGASGALLRKTLVVVQFAISIALVIATAVVLQQRRFAGNVELGYNKDQVVMLDVAGAATFRQQWEPMKRRLLAHPEITHASVSSSAPGNHRYDSVGIRAEGAADYDEMNYMLVELGFFETFDVDIVAGRPFSEDYPSDRTVLGEDGETEPRGAYVLNELAARELGWTADEAVGKSIEITAGAFFRDVRGLVVGVAEDVHFRSVRSAIEPIFYMIPPERMFGGVQMLQQVALRVTGRDLAQTLEYIDRTWREFVPGRPVARRFLDDDFEALYRAEERQGQMLGAFAALAILIACLGLFGLAAFATERRTKEIGVRKVLGATVGDVVRLFAGEFGRLVLLANLIAWPAAYFLMQRWLEGFAYRIDMNVLVFVASGVAALAAALLTVGGVAARAAHAKPSASLRYE